jgi:hypothetical protein
MIRFAALGAALLAVFFLIDSRLLYYSQTLPQEPRWWLAGAALLGFALDRGVRRCELGNLRISAAAALLGCIVVPDPHTRAALATLAAGGILAELKTLPVRWLSRTTAVVGAVGIVLGACRHLAAPAAARLHDLPWLHGPFSACLRVLGFESRTGAGVLLLERPGGLETLTVTAEKLALVPIAFLFAGLLTMLALLGCLDRRRLLWAAGLCAGYAFARGVIVLVLAAAGIGLEFLYLPNVVLLSLSPLPLLAAIALRGEPDASAVKNESTGHERPARQASSVRFAGVAAIVFGLSAGWLFEASDPGITKKGRILVDEYHSDWEVSDEPLTHDVFGLRTTYNFYNLVEFLRFHYPVVDRNYGALTSEVLAQYDVLILKTPNYLYGEDETAAIHAFIEGGGGVWLVGDHTDVFGSSRCLNQVGEPFGIRFRFDSLDELPIHERELMVRPQLGAHPTVANMPDLLSATSCSLEIAAGVDATILADTVHADAGSYELRNFFGDHDLDGTEPFGQFVQAAAVEAGKGRVAAFTDSTTLSNFTFFFPGKWELTLGSVEWLNRRNAHPGFLAAQIAAGLTVALLLLARLARRGLKGVSALGPGAAAIGVLLALAASDGLNSVAYALPAAHTEYPVVTFEREHSRYLLPILHEEHDYDEASYQAFYVWTQRSGLVPRVAPTLEDALEGDVAVFLRPELDFAPDEIDRIEAFVEGGGKVLVLDDLDGPPDSSTSRQILERFGLALGELLQGPTLDLSGTVGYEEEEVAVPVATEVLGGTSFLRTVDGRSVGSSVDRGAGRVVALGLARSYSVDKYGTPQGIPNANQLPLVHLQYRVFETVLDVERGEPGGLSRNIGGGPDADGLREMLGATGATLDPIVGGE